MNIRIAICGDVCSDCPRFLATQTNNVAELEKIAELWFRLGFRDKLVNPEELKCSGCSKDLICAHQLNNCVHLTKNNCGECDNFPCDKINMAFQKTEQLNEICKLRCTESEYQKLSRAFLMKK